MTENLKTGTTTIGFRYKDGIILAADMRATAGNLIVDKKVKKAVAINERMALTTAGSVSDIQMVMKLIKAEIRLKEVSTNRDMLVKEAANLLSNMVFRNIRTPSMMPSVAHFLFGGKDNKGFFLYDVFPDGSLTEIDDFVASGSGSVFAYGVLESLYQPELDEQGAIELATKAISASLQRDSASGNGITVIKINNDGANEALVKKLEQKL